MDIPLLELIGIGICLFFSGFFSGSETALTSLSDVKVHQLIEENPKWGKALRHWQKNHNGILATILIGNNLSNITAAALAADLASGYFAQNAIPIAIGVMTFLLLFTGEITPKAFARRYSEMVALPLMHVVLVFHMLFYPLTWVLTHFIRLLFRLVGGTGENRSIVTEQDIEYAVSLGRREGAIDKDKEHLLSSVFDFTDTTAKEIMVPRTDMLTLFVNTPYDEVMQISLESGFSRIPVKEETIDNVVGIFYTKDLLPAPKAQQKGKFLRSRMRPAVFIPESKKISEVLKLFQKDRFHLAIVVNEFGGTEGIVTMEDIIEELLGEIQDEFDIEEKRLMELSDGSFVADARIDIEELEQALRIDFPEEREYESLGGFLMEQAGDVPAVGWRHSFKKFDFSVTEADVNKVIKVHILRSPYAEPKVSTDSDSDDAQNVEASGE
ncbi:MAG: hemolysin family protein [SAR324 cluster bacterium]|nr:hemolysin family protein [SAR324 cluster bacterium]MCZ6842944.1 hemolysin family protein [SAR324 cluster bacterium]